MVQDQICGESDNSFHDLNGDILKPNSGSPTQHQEGFNFSKRNIDSIDFFFHFQQGPPKSKTGKQQRLQMNVTPLHKKAAGQTHG